MIFTAAIRIVARTIAALLIVVLTYLLFAVVLSLVSTRPAAITCKNHQEVFIGSNGIHLYFIIPASVAAKALSGKTDIPESVEYVSFGWGDKEFYLSTPTWAELKLSVALRALFTKSETAMHVTYHSKKWDGWKSVVLCDEQLTRLMAYVSRSFEVNNEDRFIELGHEGYTSNDRFFEANGNYTALKTSNNWVNIGLKTAHVKTSLWSPFPFGVMYHLGETN